jgi:hypothetical protein
MGLFDSVAVKCPQCKETHYTQSKTGECSLDEFQLNECPPKILWDINGDKFSCKCGTKFRIVIISKEVMVHLPMVVKIND